MTLQASFDAAEEIGASLENVFVKITPHRTSAARIGACLFLTIAELHLGVLATFRSRAPSTAPTLIRTMHEALVDLTLVSRDPSHLDQMRFDASDQALKVFAGFLDDEDLKSDEEAVSTLTRWIANDRAVREELSSRGLKARSVLSRFKAADMAHEYATGYRWLCSFTHTSLHTLKARHRGNGELRFGYPLPDKTTEILLGMELGFYLRAFEFLPLVSDLPRDTARAVAAACREAWSKAAPSPD